MSKLALLFFLYIAIEFPTFVGNGQSSRSRVMLAGPSGSIIGMTSTIDWTTCNHPSSLSAILCNLSKKIILSTLAPNQNTCADINIFVFSKLL